MALSQAGPDGLTVREWAIAAGVAVTTLTRCRGHVVRLEAIRLIECMASARSLDQRRYRVIPEAVEARVTEYQSVEAARSAWARAEWDGHTDSLVRASAAREVHRSAP